MRVSCSVAAEAGGVRARDGPSTWQFDTRQRGALPGELEVGLPSRARTPPAPAGPLHDRTPLPEPTARGRDRPSPTGVNQRSPLTPDHQGSYAILTLFHASAPQTPGPGCR